MLTILNLRNQGGLIRSAEIQEEEERIVQCLLDSSDISVLRLPANDLLLHFLDSAFNSKLTLQTNAFWHMVKYRYDCAQRATFTALIYLRCRRKLPRDLVTLICKHWVWPFRFDRDTWLP
jgi:hypothetical protein